MCHMHKIRIPQTSQRRAEFTFCRLIERIRPNEYHPMAIEGPIFKCGIEIDESRLWPAAHFPRVPLLLEHAGIAKPGRGHNRSSYTYVLWRFNRVTRNFDELVRCAAYGNEWLEAIRVPALNALRDPERPQSALGAAAAKRVSAAVEGELRYLEFEARGHFVSRLFDEVAGRLAYLD